LIPRRDEIVRYAIRPILVAVLSGLLAPAALAQAPVVDSANLSARLQRLERTLSSSSLLQLAQNIQALQREIRELRGELELQSRDIRRLRKRQRDLYLDIDKRLQALASAPVVAAPGANTTAAPALNTAGAGAPTPQPATASASAPPPPPVPSVGAPAVSNQTPINASATPAVPAPATASTPAIPPAAAPAPATATVDPASEQQAYRQAFDLLKAGKFDEAANALQGFLKNYPNGRFADNAQYWLGEAYYVSRKFDPALTAFERLLVDYPNSPKRSHAMLKIGFIHDEAGRKLQAKQILTQLIQRYPQSTAAGLAKKRLSRLQ